MNQRFKKRLGHRSFPVNFANFLRMLFCRIPLHDVFCKLKLKLPAYLTHLTIQQYNHFLHLLEKSLMENFNFCAVAVVILVCKKFCNSLCCSLSLPSSRRCFWKEWRNFLLINYHFLPRVRVTKSVFFPWTHVNMFSLKFY